MKLDFWSLALIIAVVVLIAIVSLSMYSNQANPKITNLQLTSSPKQLTVNGASYVVYLLASSPSLGTATIRMQELPVALNPPFDIPLSSAKVASISTDANSQYANLQIRLSNFSANSIIVDMQPIDTSLQVPISGRSASTTIPSGNTTTATTTAGTTTSTTINQTQAGTSSAMSILNKNSTYALMLNYSKLYGNTQSCTSQLYGSTYYSMKGTYPIGAATYQNVTVATPYEMNFNLTKTGPNIYLGVFSSLSHSSFTTGKAAEFTVNIATGLVTSAKTEGLFQGLNYTTLQGIYSTAASSGSACGILV